MTCDVLQYDPEVTVQRKPVTFSRRSISHCRRWILHHNFSFIEWWNHNCGYSNSVFRPRRSNQAHEMHSGCCCLWALLKLHIIQDNKLSTLLFALPKLSTLLSGCLLLEEKGSTSPPRTVIMWCMLKLKPKYQGLVQCLVMSAQLSCSSCCVQVFEAGVTCSHKAAPQNKCCTGHIFRVYWDMNTSTKNKVTFLLVLNQCLSTHFLWVLHNLEWNWRISNQTRLPRVSDAHYDKLPHYF